MERTFSQLVSLFFLLCPMIVFSQQKKYVLIDANATTETKALYKNLCKLSNKYILFGHQHATEYGHGWYGDENRSDVKSVTGSHPAVIGVDFGGLSGRSENEIEQTKGQLKKTISDTYNRGGVVTVSWHFPNPIYRGGFYWVDTLSKPTVTLLLPGSAEHSKYKDVLKTIGEFVKSIKGNGGRNVPMIFRPYHEFDGDWFWWGRAHCTIDEFKSLWRFTVIYLRDSLQVHNLIYAFSPDNKFTTEEKFLERYPGNDFVDMVGMDNYGDFGRDGHYDLNAGFSKLKIVNDFGIKAKKLAAFTETGLESIPDTSWWTAKLLNTIRRQKLKLSYVLVWRNDSKSPTHYYAPFPGQISEKDFISFYNDPYTLFEIDLKNMYK